MAHFEIKDLSFCYAAAPEHKALDNVSLHIEQGEYVTVCGRSGSGKTTLLRHLKSVLAPHGKIRGEILFEGKPLKDISLREQSARIGYVMQNPDNQIVTDKVWHELAFGLESLGCDQKTIRLRVAEMASYFGIQDWFHRDVADLSGGQKQLLNLASIMAMQPSVLILDEPTSQLDPIAASDFLNTVRKINRELRTTIIITEHRLEDIFYASDRVIVMEKGKVIANDRPEKIGEFLKGENNQMFAAMPTPVQICYGVEETVPAVREKLSALPCPLTVREGAEWLDRLFEGVSVAQTKVDKGEKYIEEDVKDPVVELQELWFRYEKDTPDILKGVSLKVPAGSLFAIVGGNGTGAHVEHAGKLLGSNLVHVRNHEQQALGCGVGSGQCTGGQGAVNSAGSAALGLHFADLDGGTEDVLLALGRPNVNVVGHGAGRGDGVNARHLGESIGNIRRSVVAVHRLEFSSHIPLL